MNIYGQLVGLPYFQRYTEPADNKQYYRFVNIDGAQDNGLHNHGD